MQKKRKLKAHTKRKLYIAIGIFLFILLYALKNTSYFTRSFGFVFVILLFFIGDYFFKFGFKNYHYAILVSIAALGILFSPLYFIYPNYDKTLHIISPVLVCILIFFFSKQNKNKLFYKNYYNSCICHFHISLI